MSDDDSGIFTNPFKGINKNLAESLSANRPPMKIPPKTRETEVVESQLYDQNELMNELITELRRNQMTIGELDESVRRSSYWSRVLSGVLVVLTIVLIVLTVVLVLQNAGVM